NPLGPWINGEAHALSPYPDPGLPAAIIDYAAAHDLMLASFASAEAQAAAIADDIAYNAHDIDERVRAGLFDVIDLGDDPLVGAALAQVLKAYPKLERPRMI